MADSLIGCSILFIQWVSQQLLQHWDLGFNVFVMKLVNDFKAQIGTLTGMSVFLLIGLLSYFAFADGTVMSPLKDGEILSASGSRWVEAGIRMFYILAALAIGSMIFFGGKKLINK